MEYIYTFMALASFVLLIVGFFYPEKSLFWLKKERTVKRSAIIYSIAFILSCIFLNMVSDKNPSKNNSSSTDNLNVVSTDNEQQEEESESEWTEIYTFRGNGIKKSQTFELTGREARLKYSYSGESGMGMGMFAIYIVDEGLDIMEDGGIPEVMTSAENEESESSIHKRAGRYYLNIQAAGNWIVTVEELKR